MSITTTNNTSSQRTYLRSNVTSLDYNITQWSVLWLTSSPSTQNHRFRGRNMILQLFDKPNCIGSHLMNGDIFWHCSSQSSGCHQIRTGIPLLCFNKTALKLERPFAAILSKHSTIATVAFIISQCFSRDFSKSWSVSLAHSSGTKVSP